MLPRARTRSPHRYKGVPTQLSRRDLIDIAPDPGFSGFNGTHERMLGVMEVLGGVLVLRRVATTHTSTLKTHSQMNPCVARLDALLADAFICAGNLDFFQMRTLVSHLFPFGGHRQRLTRVPQKLLRLAATGRNWMQISADRSALQRRKIQFPRGYLHVNCVGPRNVSALARPIHRARHTVNIALPVASNFEN